MTLKNSFLTDAYENMKRRNWVFWLSFLMFLVYFPGYLVLSLNNIRSSYENADTYGMARMQQRIEETVESLFSLNAFMPVLIIGLAILIGMQGFVYLHNKRQVDFYHSQPVSRRRRFLVLWTNGMIVFVVTYLINMLLGMGVATVYDAMSLSVFTGAWKAFFLYFFLFLGIYHISILAVLLTGNTLVSLLAMVVLLGYELAIRAMAVVLSSSFFITYGSGEEEKIFDTLLSPIVPLYKYIFMGGREYTYTQYVNEKFTYGGTTLNLVILALLFGIIGYFLYEKRASESHGNSISFPKIKEGLRFALLLLIGIFGSYLIYYIAGESVALGLAGALFFVGLGHAVIQLIYEVDFKAIKKRWVTAVISLVTVIVVFLGFKYDITGYDYRIPKQSQVESVYVSLMGEGFGNNNRYIMLDGTEIYKGNYARKNMEITDLDTIYKLLENREKIKLTTREFEGTYETIEVAFRLKNGKVKNRRLYLHYEDNLGLLDEIYHMDEYKLINNQVLEDNFVEDYRIVSANYHNGLKETKLTGVDLKALVEAYAKDYENSSYTEVYYNVAIGKITLYGIGFQSEEYRNEWDLIIYDSYANTRAILQEAGVEMDKIFDDSYLDSIQKIEVSMEDWDMLNQAGTEAVILWEDCHKMAIYNTKEAYAKILENAVPSSNFWWNNNRVPRNDKYTVLIYTPNPYNMNDYYTEEVFFQTGEIPQFIIDDLESIAFGEEKIIK